MLTIFSAAVPPAFSSVMYRWFLVSCVCCLPVCLLTLPGGSVAASNNKILIILLDGFRWDYFERGGLTGFRNFLRMGTRAEYLKNSYPTISYPNYYTIMTGLYSEDHGFIENKMYDPKHKTEFLIGSNPEQYDSYWWDDGDPLWITATRQNKSSYFYHWPGCEVTIKTLKPDYCRIYNGVPSIGDFRNSIKQGIFNFVNNSADLVGIYFELTDKIGHNFGPNSPELNSVLKESSKVIEELLTQLKEHHLENEVNVILTSDHGMTEISPDRAIDLNPVLKIEDILHVYGSVFITIWPREGKIYQVYTNLKNYHPNLTVYLKDDIPERLRLKHHYRVPPIVGIADIGWYLIKPPAKEFPMYNGQPIGGYHGYDNENTDMRGIFAGVGPDFRRNAVVPWLNAVDIYQFMCDILNIEASPNKGNSDVTNLMRPKPAPLPQPQPSVTTTEEQPESVTLIPPEAPPEATATEAAAAAAAATTAVSAAATTVVVAAAAVGTSLQSSSPSLSSSSSSSSSLPVIETSSWKSPPRPAPSTVQSSQAPSKMTSGPVKSYVTPSIYTENSAPIPVSHICYMVFLLAVASLQIFR